MPIINLVYEAPEPADIEVFNKGTSLPVSEFVLAKSWKTIQNITIEWSVSSNWSSQFYLRLIDSNQTLSDMSFVLDYYWLNPWWYLQIWKDGVSWTNYYSWWSVTYNTTYTFKLELGKTSWVFTFDGVSTTLTYTSWWFYDWVTAAFQASNFSSRCWYANYWWIVSFPSDLIYTVTYE